MGLKGSKPKLSKEDLEFLKKNTNFTEEQIKEWYKGFVQDCPKGHLTKEQFIKVYKDFFPSGSAEGFCEHVFRTFDTDNSGFIDFKEFLLAINVTSSGTPEQKLEWAFRMYDIDGNGTIDEKEMIKIIEAIYEMLGPEVTKSADDSPRKRAKMIFEKMDVNNDKELTLKEFVDGCLADKELFQILTNEVKKN
ncbi:EF-hand domain and EF-hand domain pair-containing protein [Strongyloides ratti]|uniref:EF-hand domain and EF-hand domain pair-containing protein n=5 Tax=Strongyloididae TaxID=6246 RepID=A0A090LBZ5_STRRB|nr:EF-hand domain and EF-hand domain pair-containing protein [Strongyloides ratti]CEF65060.1 EF-hand domain and EF-hand domain pair-containing protein [Strongyloides ratti]